jgi:hypothetical protein
MLLQTGIQEAQKLGFDIFITGLGAAFRTYLRAGFTLLGDIVQDDSEFGGSGEYRMGLFEKKANIEN